MNERSERHTQVNPAEIELTEDRIGSLYAALGNNEAKAITFLVMKPGVVYDEMGILNAVRGVQGDTQKGWRMGNEGPFHYLQKSLSPVGLVAEELIDPEDNKYGFVRTKWGDSIGASFAGLMLKLSNDFPNYSLYDFFGSTVSTSKPLDEEGSLKKRSPLTRINIYRALLSSGDRFIALQDLAGKIGETDVTLVGRHLEALGASSLVNYDKEAKVVFVPDNNRSLFFNIVTTFQKILDLDPATLEDGRAFASRFMTNPEAVAMLMKKAKEHSRNANQTPSEVTIDRILGIIRENPNKTTEEIRDILREKHEQALSTHRVRRMIKKSFDDLGVSIPTPKGNSSIKWVLE